MELFARIDLGTLRHRPLIESQESSLAMSVERGLSNRQYGVLRHRVAQSPVSSYPDLWGLVGVVGLGLIIVGLAIWMMVF